MNADVTNVKTLDAKQKESRKVFFQHNVKVFFADFATLRRGVPFLDRRLSASIGGLDKLTKEGA